MINTQLLATGRYVPPNRESNSELATTWGLEAGWIESRTGINSRSIASENEAVSDLASSAGRAALENYAASGQSRPNIGALILATSTPDHLLPPTSAKIASELNLENVAAFDLTVACSGFLYGMILADALCKTSGQSVLLIAANILSRRCVSDDPKTRPIFADAAGAVILGPTSSQRSILSTAWRSDGKHWDSLLIPDGGSRHPISESTYSDNRHLMQLVDGSAVFKFAVQEMAELGHQVLERAGFSISDVDWWIPHQASRRIIEACRRILRIPEQKTLTTIDKLGNSSAATIPVTLDTFLNVENGIESGDLVLLTAAAAGMTSAAILMRIP